ncbi:glycosyltransferase family 2 protein [Cyclobacterium qasimii]|uniref:Dolichol-phosphate mannosyltransferase n=2 Tax=Cyclobacterium qasimii TaxID=1350429 RepID=A0A512CEW3_9BACT|nr:glycosyltransferase family 2 protein [Cyclobacterium qasimii]EPR68826.1 putative glycosyl transferase [Cyclobacterium qasimii M12-11B]GEO22610.1 dolichol-phosphate mannosyltransferase [Cyclobacterium qasimii]
MKETPNGITIIIPVFNEEAGIKGIIPAFENYLYNTSLAVRIIFVDDGSTDKSLVQIKKVCIQYDYVDFISFEKNTGLSAAIRAGFQTADTYWVGYIDADLQTNPSDFLKLEDLIHNYDLVTGKREVRRDSRIKKLSSELANWFRNALLHDNVGDSGCPLKIIKRKVALDMPFFKGNHRFFPALALLQGKDIVEVPIKHYPRLTGKSKFNVWNRLLSPLQDTFAIRWMMKRQTPFIIYQSSIGKNKIEIK